MKFAIKAKSEGTMKTVVKAGKFELVVDEPENMGGRDEGANPLEFILAALAGCYTVVGKIVAAEMGFKLNGMDMDIEGDMNPARFAGKSFENRAGFKNISVVIKADAHIDDETRDKWIKAIEDRCPVTDNLTSTTPIDIKVE